MKKIILSFVALAMVMPATFASESKKDDESKTVLVNTFCKNWDVTLGFGAQSYLGDHVRHARFQDIISPAMDLSIQKWASPYFGIGVGFNWSGYKGIYKEEDTKAAFRSPGDPTYRLNYKQATGSYANFFVKGTFDITNIIIGYRPKPVYNLQGYVGGGIAIPLGLVANVTTAPTFNLGLVNRFNVSKHVSIDLAIRGAFIGDNFNGISYLTSRPNKKVYFDGQLGATAGITYKFGFVSKKNANTGKTVKAEWVTLPEAVLGSKQYAAAVQSENAAVNRLKTLEKKYVKSVKDYDEKVADLKTQIETAKQEAVKSGKLEYKVSINFNIGNFAVTNSQKVNILNVPTATINRHIYYFPFHIRTDISCKKCGKFRRKITYL